MIERVHLLSFATPNVDLRVHLIPERFLFSSLKCRVLVFSSLSYRRLRFSCAALLIDSPSDFCKEEKLVSELEPQTHAAFGMNTPGGTLEFGARTNLPTFPRVYSKGVGN